MTTDQPLIALISAVPAAIAPAVTAMSDALPNARIWNILDDRLLQDADEAGGVTVHLAERMERLIQHAQQEGADGVLLTCSMYGPVASRLAERAMIPVFAPDDAAFAAVVTGGYRRVLVLSSGAGPLADSVDRLRQALGADRRGAVITGAVAPDAAPAARAGDVNALVDALHAAVTATGFDADAVLLGQYSLSPAASALADRIGIPVLAGPQRAAEAMRLALQEGSPS
jgi:Asp/Glu/hydantoin racemase